MKKFLFVTTSILALIVLTGCSNINNDAKECDEIRTQIESRRKTLEGVASRISSSTSPDRSEVAVTVLQYSNYVLSAPTECVEVDDVAFAKTLLELLDNTQ